MSTKTVLAKRVVARFREYAEEYNREVTELAEQGYRPSHCIHGTYQWTDYDNICYGCEESHDWASMARADIERRMSEMKSVISDYAELMALTHKLGLTLPTSETDKVMARFASLNLDTE